MCRILILSREKSHVRLPDATGASRLSAAAKSGGLPRFLVLRAFRCRDDSFVFTDVLWHRRTNLKSGVPATETGLSEHQVQQMVGTKPDCGRPGAPLTSILSLGERAG